MVKTQSSQDQFVYICNNCNSNAETRWHCTVCDDLDLCVKCYFKDGHVHKMQILGFKLGNDSTGGDKRLIYIQSAILALEHACQCSDANCGGIRCQKMKRILLHVKKCKLRRESDICQICKQFIALGCYHSKNCQENKCPVPFCWNIKNKLKLQRMTQQQIPKPPKQNHSQSTILALEHACQCSDANCGIIRCQKMKRNLSHVKICKRRESEFCQICKEFIALSCFHSRNCQENKCPVPFCLSILRTI